MDFTLLLKYLEDIELNCNGSKDRTKVTGSIYADSCKYAF